LLTEREQLYKNAADILINTDRKVPKKVAMLIIDKLEGTI
jgi:shikimate kinase